MTNPVAPPPGAPVPAAVPGQPPVAPAPADPNSPAPPVDPAAAPVAEGAAEDQSLLAMQMNARFSIVKQSGGAETATAGTKAPTPPGAAPAEPLQPAAAPVPATLPPTTG